MTKFGLMIFPTDYALDPVVLGKEAEAFGFESLFFPEHTHIPVSRKSPWPGGDDSQKNAGQPGKIFMPTLFLLRGQGLHQKRVHRCQ